jgi:hypothetical protein
LRVEAETSWGSTLAGRRLANRPSSLRIYTHRGREAGGQGGRGIREGGRVVRDSEDGDSGFTL